MGMWGGERGGIGGGMGKEYGSINSSTFKCDLRCQNFELKFRCCAAQR